MPISAVKISRLLARAAFALAAAAATAAQAQAQQRYWYDGDVKRPLWAEPTLAAEFGPRRSAKSGVLVAAGVAKQEAATRSPVFRDGPSTGAALRALPGGAIVVLRQGTSAAAREAAFARAGISGARALGAQAHVWFVPAAAGIESLELANRLHESGEFDSAAPNWWKARALK